jgi:hypothetical protein
MHSSSCETQSTGFPDKLTRLSRHMRDKVFHTTKGKSRSNEMKITQKAIRQNSWRFRPFSQSRSDFYLSLISRSFADSMNRIPLYYPNYLLINQSCGQHHRSCYLVVIIRCVHTREAHGRNDSPPNGEREKNINGKCAKRRGEGASRRMREKDRGPSRS